MLKDVLEIVGVVLALVLSSLAAAKFWSAAKTARDFAADIGKLYDRVREVEVGLHKSMKDCQAGHADFNKEVGGHLKDRVIHRDSELETFRHETLAASIAELKSDISKAMVRVETSLCGRIATLENSIRGKDVVDGKR